MAQKRKKKVCYFHTFTHYKDKNICVKMMLVLAGSIIQARSHLVTSLSMERKRACACVSTCLRVRVWYFSKAS